MGVSFLVGSAEDVVGPLGFGSKLSWHPTTPAVVAHHLLLHTASYAHVLHRSLFGAELSKPGITHMLAPFCQKENNNREYFLYKHFRNQLSAVFQTSGFSVFKVLKQKPSNIRTAVNEPSDQSVSSEQALLKKISIKFFTWEEELLLPKSKQAVPSKWAGDSRSNLCTSSTHSDFLMKRWVLQSCPSWAWFWSRLKLWGMPIIRDIKQEG